MKTKRLFALINELKSREELIGEMHRERVELEWLNTHLENEVEGLRATLKDLGIEDIEKMSIARYADIKHAISMTDIPF